MPKKRIGGKVTYFSQAAWDAAGYGNPTQNTSQNPFVGEPVPDPNAPPSKSEIKQRAAQIGSKGIAVSDEFIDALGGQWAMDELNRIDNTMKEFGLDASDYITGVELRNQAGVYAYTYGATKAPIIGNRKWYWDKDGFQKSYADDVARRGSPQGTTYEDVLVHETGHRIEGALRTKALGTMVLPDGKPVVRGGYQDNYMKVRGADYATERLVSQACSNLKKTAWGKGMRQANMWASISRYALQNRSETYAEAICDYMRNGKNSSPLSQEIVRLTKQYLNG